MPSQPFKLKMRRQNCSCRQRLLLNVERGARLCLPSRGTVRLATFLHISHSFRLIDYYASCESVRTSTSTQVVRLQSHAGNFATAFLV